jgi:hypothetical protein
MADLEYDDYASEQDYAYDTHGGLAHKARRWVNICGALCSVTLVLGLTLWGYKLAMRDVTGIPVMRAVAGAMRTAPADPGGEQALNQGLTVNAIAAMGTSAALADQITLAPDSVSLQASDAPLVPAAAPDAAAAEDPASPVDGSAPDPMTAVIEASATIADAAAPKEVVINDPRVLTQSLRPQPRPQSGLATSGGKMVPTKVQTVSGQSGANLPPAKEIDPGKIPVGTRLAQLGAFETPDLAREKFAALQGDFGDLMTGKAMVIQAAQSGGHTFYRLRAYGFETDDDTRRFCAAFAAENADCIPVAQR